jgi:adenine-specific DNA-methyltransferase
MLNRFTRHDARGATNVAEAGVHDNLIIKGDNLVVMQDLQQTHAGAVKMVYIDPPYNTGSALFQYNDNVSHEAWLDFMAQRLQAARVLLRDDGVIFVHCDDNEQAYVKVLMDRLYGRENFVDTFIWKNTDNAPNLSYKSRRNAEFIHCYEKNLDRKVAYRGRPSDNDDAPLLNTGNPPRELAFPAGSIHFGIPDNLYARGIYECLELLDDLVVRDARNVAPVRMRGAFKWTQKHADDEIRNGTHFIIRTRKMSIRYQRKLATVLAPDKLIDSVYLSRAVGVGTNEDSSREMKMLDSSFTSYPKPESLLAFLINAVTQPGDLVMDFFLGSGTTAAAAHKMGRRYIGIEQMDYIEDAAVARLKRVITGEQGGVSAAYGWKGGGSFLYAEWQQDAAGTCLQPAIMP